MNVLFNRSAVDLFDRYYEEARFHPKMGYGQAFYRHMELERIAKTQPELKGIFETILNADNYKAKSLIRSMTE